MQNKHILLLPSWYPANSQDIRGCFFREQALALLKTNAQVGVITVELRSLKRWKSIFTDRHGLLYENDFGIKTFRFKTMFWFPKIPYLINKLSCYGGIKAFYAYVEEFGMPDILHVHSCLYMGEVARYVKNKYGIPYVVTEHSSGYIRNLYSRYQEVCAENILKSSSEAIAVSNSMAGYFKSKFLSEIDWKVVPNIVNPIFFEKNIGLSKSRFTFINVAFMNQNKNQINIIKAIDILNKEGVNDIDLVIIGDGVERKKLENYISQNKIKNIKLLGAKNREQIAEIMSHSDCFVLSSNFETFGVVVIEALALGLPVVATRCGGPEDIVTQDNGLLVEKDNIEALAAAMQKIKENNLGNDKKFEIRTLCYEQYSESAVIDNLMTIYEKVLS